MDAHVKTVREILHSGDQFLVPFFQRHYSWRKEHWQHLLDNIVALTEEAPETNHFLGPLVCTPFHPIPGEVTPYQLIDGQQRLAHIPFVRGKYALSTNPTVDFLNPRKGRPFGHKLVPGTELYVFTNTDNEEKRDDLCGLAIALDFPPDGVEVTLATGRVVSLIVE